MDTRELLAELADEALRDRVETLTARMRCQKGSRRRQTYQDIAELINLRRILSEAKRPDATGRRKETDR